VIENADKSQRRIIELEAEREDLIRRLNDLTLKTTDEADQVLTANS
jgi:hypothetical protein